MLMEDANTIISLISTELVVRPRSPVCYIDIAQMSTQRKIIKGYRGTEGINDT